LRTRNLARITAIPRLPRSFATLAPERAFVGVGVRVPTLIDPEVIPPLDDVQALARSLGIFAADRWIYLYYVCWGGDIDFVYGLGSRDGALFGPVEESDHGKAEAVYTGLMEDFGISEEDAQRFEPFVRGFWGDARRGAVVSPAVEGHHSSVAALKADPCPIHAPTDLAEEPEN
jgi:hypothetical protein